MTPTRILLPALFLAAFLAPAASRGAEERREEFVWPSHTRNLKVLPRNTSPERLRAVMTGFTRALGVRCPYCHVGAEGQPLSTYDFASDRKGHKIVARGMMKMVGRINEDLDRIRRDEQRARARSRRDGAGADEATAHQEHGDDRARAEGHEAGGHEHGEGGEVNVECVTCHRGLAVPRVSPRSGETEERPHSETPSHGG